MTGNSAQKKYSTKQEFEKAIVVTNNNDNENLKELNNIVDFCPRWKKQEENSGKAIINNIWVNNLEYKLCIKIS
ncbi:MAG TPA: hypothetical protein VFP25_03705 [Nitrososphaeraceae archaeon]|nr:hypothetical protein [Nitrososphaeraceae archaeon]